jgi:hypothetical protein
MSQLGSEDSMDQALVTPVFDLDGFPPWHVEVVDTDEVARCACGYLTDDAALPPFGG